MDPKGRLSSQIHFLVPLGITYSEALHCGNTFDQTHIISNLILRDDIRKITNSCFFRLPHT